MKKVLRHELNYFKGNSVLMADFNVPSLNVSLMDGGLIVLDQISVVVNKPSMEYLKKKASNINIYKMSLTPTRLLSSCLGCFS